MDSAHVSIRVRPRDTAWNPFDATEVPAATRGGTIIPHPRPTAIYSGAGDAAWPRTQQETRRRRSSRWRSPRRCCFHVSDEGPLWLRRRPLRKAADRMQRWPLPATHQAHFVDLQSSNSQHPIGHVWVINLTIKRSYGSNIVIHLTDRIVGLFKMPCAAKKQPPCVRYWLHLRHK